jgi:hypothetical protein
VDFALIWPRGDADKTWRAYTKDGYASVAGIRKARANGYYRRHNQLFTAWVEIGAEAEGSGTHDIMRKEQVEIYSDTTNAAVLRHPDRHFPGCLVQGDTLNGLWQAVRRVQRGAHLLDEEAAAELKDVADHLESLLSHYKTVLSAHAIELPFTDQTNG